jgi:hypothetical protein
MSLRTSRVRRRVVELQVNRGSESAGLLLTLVKLLHVRQAKT